MNQSYTYAYLYILVLGLHVLHLYENPDQEKGNKK